MPKESK